MISTYYLGGLKGVAQSHSVSTGIKSLTTEKTAISIGQKQLTGYWGWGKLITIKSLFPLIPRRYDFYFSFGHEYEHYLDG